MNISEPGHAPDSKNLAVLVQVMPADLFEDEKTAIAGLQSILI